MLPLPEDFVRNIRMERPGDADRLFKALDGIPPVSVRWNPYKTHSAAEGEAVPWNRYGRYLASRPSFTADPLFHAGAYYVQEASSMFVEHLLRNAMPETAGLRILDACAAPGGKTTLYSTLAGAEGMVVANEVIRTRAAVLTDNVRKWGIGNTIVTNNDTAHFTPLHEWFDVVAIDAPCSGEGMFRKNPEARGEWSESNTGMCAARQRRIITDLWDTLRPGGLLIYSTCTFNRKENEDNVAWIAENFDCEDAGITVDEQWGIECTSAGGIGCFRFWPHAVAGEGFFAAAIRKCGQKGRPARPRQRKNLFSELQRNETRELSRWVGQPDLMRFARIGDNIYGYYGIRYDDMKAVAENLTSIYSGVCMGQLFSGRLKPDHSLAMFHDLSPDAVTVAELGIEDALAYLRKDERLPAADKFKEGMNLVTFDGHALGWAKRIGNRINNMYPKSMMILFK